jgi:hypothetical protein
MIQYKSTSKFTNLSLSLKEISFIGADEISECK